MRRARGWLLGLVALGGTSAFACALPSLDEYARSGASDAGSASDAKATDDATTAMDAGVMVAAYVRFEAPARALEGADLTAAGPLDWVQWQDPMQRCSGCTTFIGALTSGSPVTEYADDTRTWTWSNGVPRRTGSAMGGLYIEQVGGTFQLPVELPDMPVVLTLHADVYHSSGRLDATLDGVDAGTVPSVSAPEDVYGYVFVVHAFGPGRTLHLTWTMTASAAGDANVAVAALTVAPEP